MRVFKMKTSGAVLVALSLVSCSATFDHSSGVNGDQPPVVKADQPFAAAGAIEMQLESGDYVVRPAADQHIRVSFGGNTGSAVSELSITGTHANLAVRNTPHNNFRAIVEVPSASDLTIHLTAGELQMAGINGNKDIDSKAGNVEISVPNKNDYGTLDASVKVGNLDAGPFGEAESGLSPHISWSGPGKHNLRVSLGAGNLELK